MRWLLLILPPPVVEWISGQVALIGSGKISGDTLSAALTNVWQIEGSGPIEFPFAFANGLTSQMHSLHLLPAEHEGKLYVPGEPMGLYVLFKPLKVDAGTDAGWVYATIAADMTITGAGKIGCCMACHQTLPGRLFGLQKSAPH